MYTGYDIKAKPDNGLARQAFAAAWDRLAKGDFAEAQKHMAAYKTLIDYGKFVVLDNRDACAPQASVVIVACNTGRELVKCVQSVLSPGRPDLAEIIVVDNGGNEEVRQILCDFPLLYVRTPFNLISSEGRNVGVSHARAPVSIFLDDDALALPDFVPAALAAFSTLDACAVRGRIAPKTQSGFRGLAPHYDLGDVPLPHIIDTEGNSAWRTVAYRAVGGMDPLLFGHEGADLSMRLTATYGRCVSFYWPTMRILHDYASDEAKNSVKCARHRLMDKYLCWKLADGQIKAECFPSFHGRPGNT